MAYQPEEVLTETRNTLCGTKVEGKTCVTPLSAATEGATAPKAHTGKEGRCQGHPVRHEEKESALSPK